MQNVLERRDDFRAHSVEVADFRNAGEQDTVRNFKCANCGLGIHFHNTSCVRCGHELGFSSDRMDMMTLSPSSQRTAGGELYQLYEGIGYAGSGEVRYCRNHAEGVCNWLVAADSGNTLCKACEHNRTIPNLSIPANRDAWADLEKSKKHLVYTLMRLGLPLDGSAIGKGPMVFDFVQHATIAHFDGVITIDVVEADSVERERQRQILNEPYRSLLGHLRHESGHYYWMLLIEGAGRLDAFRNLFGDERMNYLNALDLHRSQGPVRNWQSNYISAYASSHPWEDWAETWAHYLHIIDALETAETNGVLASTTAGSRIGRLGHKALDPYVARDFKPLIDRWIPLTVAMNELSRSIGHPDFYPFVLSQGAIDKLSFVHDTIVRQRRGKAARHKSDRQNQFERSLKSWLGR